MQDWRGTDIKVGDNIVYITSVGSGSFKWHEATVVSLHDDHIVVDKELKGFEMIKTLKLRAFHNMMVVK